MKLETKKQIEFATNSSFESIDATISSTDMHKLWDMLQNPYKDNISSIVRECTSNSFDAIAEAMFIKEHNLEEIRKEYGIYNTVSDEELLLLKKHVSECNNDAVAVSVEKDETGWYWSTEDIGVGLSPSRVRTVFVNYLKSTKELSNTMIGAFGLGSKSPLSYTDVFFIRTRYNSIEYNYMLRKGENGPALDIISEEPTTERNGTEIKIYLNTDNDLRFFRNACEKQLSYFNNVYFSENTFVSNDYQLIQGDNWIASTRVNPYSGLHICLGTVSYPIDWNILELSSIDLPIALRFEIGELDVIQTREDVKYTPRTKDAIIVKIEMLRQELTERWNKVDKECKSIQEYYDCKSKKPFLSFDTDKSNIAFDISTFINLQDNGYYYKPFRDAGITNSQLPKEINDLFLEYKISGWFSQRFQKEHYSMSTSHLNSRSNRDTKTYRILGEHDPKKSKSILYENPSLGRIKFVRKEKKITLKQYITVLSLKRVPKSEWRKQITVFQKEMQKWMVRETISYDKTPISQEYLESVKKVRGTRDTTEIKVDYYNGFGINSHYTKNSQKMKVCNIEKDGRTNFIVGETVDYQRLRAIGLCYKLFSKTPTKYLKHYQLAPTNIKKLKNIKNLITVETFKTGESTVFKKTMSFIRVHNKYKTELDLLIKKISTYRKDTLTEVFINLCPELGNKLYNNRKFLENGKDLLTGYYNREASGFLKECYKQAEIDNLFDLKFENELVNIIESFKKYQFLLKLDTRGEVEDVVDVIRDYIYFHNIHCSKQDRIPLGIMNTIYLRGKYTKKSNKVVKVKQDYLLPV
jgi:hypothetical protein